MIFCWLLVFYSSFFFNEYYCCKNKSEVEIAARGLPLAEAVVRSDRSTPFFLKCSVICIQFSSISYRIQVIEDFLAGLKQTGSGFAYKGAWQT
jgi:hypothetical protein